MNNIHQNKNTFFAAANTPDGFVSYFDKIFGENEVDVLYILKGGPGVGKSTFMKKIGKSAEDMGEECEYFLCSSDPYSLDGVIMKNKRTAVIDGTSPHAVEPKYAGAREIIVDLGRSWDTKGLQGNVQKIRTLSNEKSKYYNECYELLSCKRTIDDMIYNLVLPCILPTKMQKGALNLCKSLFKKGKFGQGNVKVRITNAISTKGKVSLETFQNMANNVIYLKEPCHESRVPSLFMKKIFDYAKKSDMKIYVSYSPMSNNRIDALFFPSISTCICLYDQDSLLKCDRIGKKAKIINTARFIDQKAFSRVKPLRKFYSKLSLNLEAKAVEKLSLAGKAHADLEKSYASFTDYKAVESISRQYFDLILKD